MHKTCTGTKKRKFWTSRCTKPAQGQKKQKKQNFTIYLGRGDYSSKVLAFSVFCSWAGLVHFEVQNFDFLVPVQVWRSLKFKTQCICSFVFWYCFYCLQVFLTHMAFFLLPMQIFEASGAFFMQRVYNLNINLILFRKRFCFQEIGVFPFELSIYLIHMHSGCIFDRYLQWFWTCVHIHYLVI